MKEICLVFESCFYKTLLELKEKLKNVFDIVVVLKTQSNVKLIIAVKKENFKENVSILNGKICEIIKQYYKRRYILNFLKAKGLDKNKLLIVNLLNFDEQSDNDYIVNKLNYNFDINIKSFVNFSLQILVKKWKEMGNLTEQNYDIYSLPKFFIVFINFLNKNAKSSSEILNVNVKNNIITIDNKNFKVRDFINYFFKINPQKVVVKINEKSIFEKLICKREEYSIICKKIEYKT